MFLNIYEMSWINVLFVWKDSSKIWIVKSILITIFNEGSPPSGIGDNGRFWLWLLWFIAPKHLIYLTFQSFDFERIWWRLFQKRTWWRLFQKRTWWRLFQKRTGWRLFQKRTWWRLFQKRTWWRLFQKQPGSHRLNRSISPLDVNIAALRADNLDSTHRWRFITT